MSREDPRVAILGAGPVGLDAALAAADAGLPFTVYEAGDRPAAHVRAWGHVRLFSPWSMNVSPRMVRYLDEADFDVPEGDACVRATELVERVLDPVAALPVVAAGLRLGTRVEAVGREGLLKHEAIGTPERAARPFRLLVRGPDGRQRVEHADVVLDCTGTYGQPNALGDGGIPAIGERAMGSSIVRHLPDVASRPEEWAAGTVLLVGAGHSAWTAVAELAELAGGRPGTRVLWAIREEAPAWAPIPGDPLVERSALAARALELAGGASPAVELLPGSAVEALERRGERIRVRLRRGGRVDELDVDRVLALTGYVGDASLHRQLQVHECYATCGPMKLAAALLGSGSSADCLEQASHGADALVNPEPGFFVLGIKSYGRNNTFLMRVGWHQVEDVFSTLPAAVAPAASP